MLLICFVYFSSLFHFSLLYVMIIFVHVHRSCRTRTVRYFLSHARKLCPDGTQSLAHPCSCRGRPHAPATTRADVWCVGRDIYATSPTDVNVGDASNARRRTSSRCIRRLDRAHRHSPNGPTLLKRPRGRVIKRHAASPMNAQMPTVAASARIVSSHWSCTRGLHVQLIKTIAASHAFTTCTLSLRR